MMLPRTTNPLSSKRSFSALCTPSESTCPFNNSFDSSDEAELELETRSVSPPPMQPLVATGGNRSVDSPSLKRHRSCLVLTPDNNGQATTTITTTIPRRNFPSSLTITKLFSTTAFKHQNNNNNNNLYGASSAEIEDLHSSQPVTPASPAPFPATNSSTQTTYGSPQTFSRSISGARNVSDLKVKDQTLSDNADSDLVFVRDLSLKAHVGLNAWNRDEPQPTLVSMWLKTNVALAGSTDYLPYSIHYGTVADAITVLVESTKFKSLQDMAEKISQVALSEECGGEWVRTKVTKTNGTLRAEEATIEIVRRRDGTIESDDSILIEGLTICTILGVHPWERLQKQRLGLHIVLYRNRQIHNQSYDYRSVVAQVADFVEKSDYFTVEALATNLAEHLCINCGVSKCTIRIEKPSALTFAQGAGVQVTRDRSFFDSLKKASEIVDGKHEAFISFGSNLGDRAGNISKALKYLSEHGIAITGTSGLYETKPMYVTDQPEFLNGVVRVQTKLGPTQLLRLLQTVESDVLGRVKTIDKGPRTIDLDILFFDNAIVNEPDLVIPHQGILEREFVLRPLCDVASNKVHPSTSLPINQHLRKIAPYGPNMSRMIPLRRTPESYLRFDRRRTLVMGILNSTPDSFSDGGKYNPDNAVEQIQKMLVQGADIIDIGGQSTRPGSEVISTQEELDRVIPLIKRTRGSEIDVPISIDTYNSEVALEAIKAGADIINDISSGQMDEKMLDVVRDLDVPIVLMHMRGTPQTMTELAQYKDVVEEVGQELEARVEEALARGIRSWNIILDPGIGFSKKKQHNLDLIRHFDKLRSRTKLQGYPWLLAASRKRFIGTVTGVSEPSDRSWGTAGVISAGIAGGVDMVRVHDVEEMKKVVLMADAIYRDAF